MITKKAIEKRFLSTAFASIIGLIFVMINIDPNSTIESTFFTTATFATILTDAYLIKRVEEKPNPGKEIIIRIIALIIPCIIIGLSIGILPVIGFTSTYLILGIFEEYLLNKPSDPPTNKTTKQKITIFILMVGSMILLCTCGILIALAVGYFNGLEEINKSILTPASRLTRIQWLVQFGALGIAGYYILLQRNKINKFSVDFLIAVHFVHVLLSTIWPFTLTALWSSSIATISMLCMTAFMFWFAFLTKKISKSALYFILPILIARMIGFHTLITAILLNPDRWDII